LKFDATQVIGMLTQVQSCKPGEKLEVEAVLEESTHVYDLTFKLTAW